MSQDRPSIDELLRTVKEFVDATARKLEGEARFHSQIASYLLAICERELCLGAASDRAEREQLSAFLEQDGSLSELNTIVCRRIRSGELDECWDHTLRILLTLGISKVAIVRPDHLAPMHRTSAA